MVTRHTLGEYSRNFLEASSTLQARQRKEGYSTQQRNETDVLEILKVIDNDWCNPFDYTKVPSSLINICTGKEANEEIENSICTFIDELANNRHLVFDTNNNEKVNFWKPRNRNKILTFKENKTTVKSTRTKSIIGSELMFRRTLCAAQLKEINLKMLLSHELTLVPLSLFHDDQSMRKTAKSDFAKKLEDTSNKQIDWPSVESFIVDGMVAIQELNENKFITFNDLGNLFFESVLVSGRKCHASRIIIVFDTYKSHSLKAAERARRGENNITEFNVSGGRKVYKFRNFLKSSKNKQYLLHFLTEYVVQNHAKFLRTNETLIIAGGFENSEKVVICQNGLVQPLKNLYSNQEEADTRIILHTIEESKVSRHILVKSVDTDVLILLIHFMSTTSDLSSVDLYIQLGHSTNRRFVLINKIVQNFGVTFCSCLLSVHCLTGCDTTSAFYKIGKKSAFEVLKKNQSILDKLSQLPRLPEIEALELATRYVLLLYKNTDRNIKTLNELRLKLAINSNKPSTDLPPTDAAFYQHFLRCIYQLKIWYSSNIANTTLFQDVERYGWQLVDDTWTPIFSNQQPIPNEVRHSLNLFCSDKTYCINRKCTCIREGLKCCEQCKCVECSNCVHVEISDDEEEMF